MEVLIYAPSLACFASLAPFGAKWSRFCWECFSLRPLPLVTVLFGASEPRP
jgi:hypothetical protein